MAASEQPKHNEIRAPMKYTLAMVLLTASFAKAQHTDSGSCLFHVGLANTLLGGLYDGFYSVDQLKTKGNFGIGAPHRLDGELLILNGRVWQTTHIDSTFEADGSTMVPYAAVHDFAPVASIQLNGSYSRDQLFAILDTLLAPANGMFGVKVSGTFATITTRAFPAVTDYPAPALASIMDRQVLFNHGELVGALVGYKLPPFMAGMNFPGYHFHFLSDDHRRGGHMVDFTAWNITIEYDRIHRFEVQLPSTPEFNSFDFSADRSSDARTIQRGQ
jgi:acetolactate decarboxylase